MLTAALALAGTAAANAAEVYVYPEEGAVSSIYYLQVMASDLVVNADCATPIQCVDDATNEVVATIAVGAEADNIEDYYGYKIGKPILTPQFPQGALTP